VPAFSGWILRRFRHPSAFVPEEQLDGFFISRGIGLPGVHDLILGRNDDALSRITKTFIDLFPTVTHLRVRPESTTTKTITIELHGGTVLQPTRFSEGMLYYLAFAALGYIAPASLLLVEEPENGLHPSRIADHRGRAQA
jgi:predicted ATPase